MENQQTIEFNTQLQFQNKYQHKLIVLISSIEYVNNKHEKYTQSNLLYYFNGNLRRNGQKETTIRTLQKYLYKLNKEFKVTNNYYCHLGVNMGTEVYYKLKYSKKKCHRLINKYFKNKKEEKFQKRINNYFKKLDNKKGSVEKGECYYNIYNNKKEENKDESKQFIEELQIKKYAKKCNFKSNTFLSILNLNTDKDTKIEVLRIMKRNEYSVLRYKNKVISSDYKKKSEKLENKQKELHEILNKVKKTLKNKGYNVEQLKREIKKIFYKYKNKPHFIIESEKYEDLNKIIERLEKKVELNKSNKKEENKKNIRSNIFSILFDQLTIKVDIEILVPILKNYLNKQKNLDYKKVFNNHYYYELLNLIENDTKYLKTFQFKKTVN